MFEININNYNEMLRYERDMDILRALALWIAQPERSQAIPALDDPKQYVFDLIKFYSRNFASEIFKNGSISSESISTFHSSLFTINRLLGIGEADILRAGEQQRYRNSGFWEMRRYLGQFYDIAEYATKDGITHIISAAVSGCIIGEYLSDMMSRQHQYQVPVDHMVFSRSGREPVAGFLPENFVFSGDQILIVDDAVMETTTSRVMIKELLKINPGISISLMSVAIDPDTRYSGYLKQFKFVYTFDE
jgi:hypothetical protein